MAVIASLADMLASHGGALILPLAVVEGPVVSVMAGWLCERGQISWYRGLLLLVGGDLIGDLMYYALGRSGGLHLGRLGSHRLARVKLPEGLLVALHANATRMLLIGKWTHAIGAPVLVGAGIMRMQLPRFLLVNLLATLPKSILLFATGYLAWPYWQMVARHTLPATLALLAIGAIAVVLILRSRRGGWTGAIEP